MSQTTSTTVGPLTVVLVHGAFADASSWTGVIERLQARGVQVTAPANPLRGLASDSAYLASNVVGLVYVAAFAPEEGERLGEVESTSKDSILSSAQVALHYPTGQGAQTAVEFAVNPAHFHEAFAADLPVEQAAVMAATQRPVAELAFSEPSGVPAWKTLPSWAVVASGDKAAGSDAIRSMASRAGATITEVEGSHVIMISQPQVVTDVILRAVAAVSETGGRPHL